MSAPVSGAQPFSVQGSTDLATLLRALAWATALGFAEVVVALPDGRRVVIAADDVCAYLDGEIDRPALLARWREAA